jgi:hypothetical protein
LLRGAKGYGWYNNFIEKGAAGFSKFTPPTPFDWTLPKDAPKRPHAYFDIKIDQEKLGRIKIELASDIVPKTVENFKALCLGEGKKHGGYKNTKIHHVLKGVTLAGGDVEYNDGTGGHSAGMSRFFKDENTIIPHSSRGLVRLALKSVII